MTFTAFESSQETSQPIELYTFTIGTTVTRATSAEDDVTWNSNQYGAIALSRTKLNGGGTDSRDQEVVLTLPGDHQIPKQYIDSVPGVKATVAIQRVQRNDTSFDVVIIFEGDIDSVAFTNSGRQAKIKLQPFMAATSRPVPRFNYQGLCNHVLYDGACQVDDTSASFRLSSAAVTAESGSTITVTGADANGDGYYDGGFVENVGSSDRRLILSQVGTVLTLLLPFASSVNGSNVTVFAGCDHTIAICKSKFNNVINYGGFAFVPTKNIFETGITI